MIQKHNIRLRQSGGFTLIELMLAMAFVTTLLLVIASVVLQIGGTYNKGITIKSVNQAGRSVVADMRRTIAANKPFVVASAFVSKTRMDGATTVTEGGRLCIGSYTYVWNIGTATEGGTVGGIHYSGTDSTTPLRFVRVTDSSGKYCADPSLSIDKSRATELFADSSLAVQSFAISQVTTNATVPSQLYRVSMMISNATNDAIDTVGGSCKVTSDIGSYGNYCAVNVFDFTVQAGSNGGSQ